MLRRERQRCAEWNDAKVSITGGGHPLFSGCVAGKGLTNLHFVSVAGKGVTGSELRSRAHGDAENKGLTGERWARNGASSGCVAGKGLS